MQRVSHGSSGCSTGPSLSGFQAALFDGESAKEYATSSRLRTQANGTQLTANETLIYNASTFTAWLQGKHAQSVI